MVLFGDLDEALVGSPAGPRHRQPDWDVGGHHQYQEQGLEKMRAARTATMLNRPCSTLMRPEVICRGLVMPFIWARVKRPWNAGVSKRQAGYSPGPD